MRSAIAAVILGLGMLSCRALLAAEPTATAPATLTQAVTVEVQPSPTTSPSITPRPTRTPRPFVATLMTPSAQPLFALPSPGPTATSAPELACRLEWQSPGSGVEIVGDKLFSTGWKVTNTGTDNWNPERVFFTYLGGAKLHNDPIVTLPERVRSGESVVLTVPMLSPKHSTKYTTYWSLRRDETFFCRVSLTIYVKEK